MDVNSLILKWDKIEDVEDNKGYRALRISADCIPELYIATDFDGYRCLLLYLPTRVEVKLKGTDKKKLELSYFPTKNIIFIKLNDFDFVDLFNDLILSLYFKIKDLADPNHYSKELIYSFYKWSEFFEDRLETKLTYDEIKGLYGELFILIDFLKRTDSTNINTVLESWKGPYDTTNDFIFDDKNIEVKTKDDSKSFVKISSEYQLEREFDKGLELLVVSVKTDVINGESINDLLNKLVSYIRKNLGDLPILYRALGQKGLTMELTKKYNNYRFIVSKTNSYDCVKKDFPKLSVSNLPVEISGLNYYLRITTLNNFLLEEIIF